jgi:predicted CoA-binding protein
MFWRGLLAPVERKRRHEDGLPGSSSLRRESFYGQSIGALSSSLDSLFRLQSVAVFSASAKPGTVANILMRNLLENPFGGVVFPINPKRHAVRGLHCYLNLAAVPVRVELAVIATPAGTVPNVVRDCVEGGVFAAIIISAGFAELGAEGRTLEEEIHGVARSKMRIVGPNCLGIIHPPSSLNASFAASMAATGNIALYTQPKGGHLQGRPRLGAARTRRVQQPCQRRLHARCSFRRPDRPLRR